MNKIYLILLSLSIIFYFVIFVLDIKISDLIGENKFNNLLRKLRIENFSFKPMTKQNVRIQYPPLLPQSENNILMGINDNVDSALLNMDVNNNRLLAANENIEEESPAMIQDQKTNISAFLKLNSSLLYDTNRHNVRMGDPEEWNLKGTQMFNKILNDKTTIVEPFDVDKNAGIYS